MSLDYRVITAADLDASLMDAWIALQEAQPAFHNPYFRPEFTQAISAARPDVRIAILEDASGPVGFLPFQQEGRTGRPVGGKLSDFQGMVIRPDVAWSPEKLLSVCGLRNWHFDHLLADQTEFRPYHDVVCDSAYLDLSKGFEEFDAERRRAGTEETRQSLRKARRFEREVGQLRLEYHTESDAVWEKLKAWKAEQYAASGLCDVLNVSWVQQAMNHIRKIQTPGFSGVLSALYCGDEPLAAHFGMRSHEVLHWWFPSYNRDMSRHSPGTLLLLKVAQEAQQLGIHRIDLGKGPEQYKRGWASGMTLVAEGCLEPRGLPRAVRTGLVKARQWLKQSRYAHAPARWLRPLRSWWALR